ncbi:hypothetical protein Aoki45_34790 [Algoriphagus sp. oki45]|uniref:hypothetical protein n=1 Tax=Algoriphagus sp. oki45 TaxID=3067294 RepID=UPI0027E9C1C7|nr:hypothetical protein Aoki45_34790 [Algoriphagus sp. oki45]
MEKIATFSLLFMVYFLGSLALVQLSIRPMRKLIIEAGGNGKHWQTNYLKIMGFSLLLSLVTTLLAFYLFPDQSL